MLLLALLQPALACDPVDFELAFSHPAEGGTVSAEVAPLLHAWTFYTVTVRVVDEDLEEVPGVQTDLDVNGWSRLIRFVPDAPLDAGAYTLIVDVEPEIDRTVEVAFTVDADAPVVPALDVRQPEATYLEFEEAGADMCDSRAAHHIEALWDVPDAAAAEVVALSLHLADGPEGPVDEAPVRVYRGDLLDERALDTRFYTDDDGPRTVCMALRSWATSPEGDATSEVFCTEEPGGLLGGSGGVGGCSCSSPAGPAGGGLAALLGLGVLVWGRRRR